jgi:hypothetical protein
MFLLYLNFDQYLFNSMELPAVRAVTMSDYSLMEVALAKGLASPEVQHKAVEVMLPGLYW